MLQRHVICMLPAGEAAVDTDWVLSPGHQARLKVTLSHPSGSHLIRYFRGSNESWKLAHARAEKWVGKWVMSLYLEVGLPIPTIEDFEEENEISLSFSPEEKKKCQ